MRPLLRLCSPPLAAALFVLMAAGIAAACSIPVFRYALEQWRPDPYEVLVYYREALSDEQQALLSQLTPEYVPGEPIPNVAVSRVDLDGKVRPEFAAIWEEEQGASLPWVVVRTPWHGKNETVWTGALSDEAITVIQHSPMRSELVKRLAGGESIVWLLLEGETPSENDRLAAEITRELKRLQQEIQLPAIDAEDLSKLSVSPDQLGLRFSILRIQRDSPSEQLLLRSLLTVQPGLNDPELASEPMLFPVFGRGRVYFPLVGSAIEPANLEDLARFLSGACQCTIKQQNPGVDLLTTVDWDAYVLGIETEKPLPPLAGLGGFTAGPDVEETDDSTPPAIPDSPSLPNLDQVNREVPNDTTSSAVSSPEVEPAVEPVATQPSVSIPVGSDAASRAGTVGSQVFWVIGLVTTVVVIVSLWMIPRRSA